MKNLLLSVAIVFFFTATVVCGTCTYGNIRLYNGTSSSNTSGMLQICSSSGHWVAVCDYGWGQNSSVVVCKQLGYTNPFPITTINSGYWSTLGYVSHYYYSCSATTANILHCLTNSSYYLQYSYYCSSYRDTVSIQCDMDTSGCSYDDIRLYNSTSSNSTVGMLQICNSQGHWTAVCDYSFGCNEATVACRQLGYNSAVPRYFTNAGPWTEIGFGPYSYCYSTYTSLFSCSQYSSYYRNSPYYCSPMRDTVKLECIANQTNNCTNNDVRLVGGHTNYDGNLEICYGGAWRSICSSYVSSSMYRVAATVCNQLEISSASGFAEIYSDGRYGAGNTLRYLSSVYCSRKYTNIKYCSKYAYNSYYYYSSQCDNSYCSQNVIAMKCYVSGNCNEGAVRLVNGTLEKEGRLEVCSNGVWGTFCGGTYYSNTFSKSAAHVSCQQLGYNDHAGAIIYKNSKFGKGDGPVIYSNVDCYGHENIISECSKTMYPNFTCSNYYYGIIGILCLDNCDDGEIRLVGAADNSTRLEGTVEVCIDQMWSLVADNGWDNLDAQVVCRQLGYGLRDGIAVNNSAYGKPKRAVRYSNVYCHGNEERLMDCTYHKYEYEDGRLYNKNAHVAGVDCGVSLTPTVSSTPNPTTTTTITVTSTVVSTALVEVCPSTLSCVCTSSSTITTTNPTCTTSTVTTTLPPTSCSSGTYPTCTTSTVTTTVIPTTCPDLVTPSTQASTSNNKSQIDGILIGGILFLILATAVLITGITLIGCVSLQIKKLYKLRADPVQMSTIQTNESEPVRRLVMNEWIEDDDDLHTTDDEKLLP